MAEPSNFAAPEILASIGAEASGPDGQYVKAVRKSDIKIDSKLDLTNYLTWSEEIEIQLKAKRVLKMINGTTPQPDKETQPTNHKE